MQPSLWLSMSLPMAAGSPAPGGITASASTASLVEQATSGPTAMKLVLMMTLLSMAPAIVLTMTCFLRFVIVFAFLRQALGVQGAPPSQVTTGLALFMTAAVMSPVAERLHAEAIAPYMNGSISEQVALERASGPLRRFMIKLTSAADIELFCDATHRDLPKTASETPLSIVVPAFVTSELRTAFEMGLSILIPFLVIDLIVASVLMALGMAMLSPMLVSLPLKLLVFLYVDGWSLLVGSLIKGVA